MSLLHSARGRHRLPSAAELARLLRDSETERGRAEEAAAQQRETAERLREELAKAKQERDFWHEKADRLETRFGPQLAAEAANANANAVTVPPMVRDTSAIEDQATVPVPVQTLREAAAAGLL